MTTQTVTHHLTDALLMGYSAGTLPEAYNLAVAAHISMCDTCRARLAEFDAVGGALLEDCGETSLAEDSLAQTMARIKSGAPAPKTAPAAPARKGILPKPLQDYVGGDVEAIRWSPVGGGVKQAILKTSKEASARLLYIPAGTAVPDHGHKGLELTLVLQGAFEDEDGRFGVGDIEVADDAVEHTPVADISEDCICLAVTDAPLRFKGLLPRLAQPFVKI